MSNVLQFPASRIIKVAEELNFKRLNEDEGLRAAAGIRDALEFCQHIPNYTTETTRKETLKDIIEQQHVLTARLLDFMEELEK